MPASNQNHDTVVIGVKKHGAHPDLIRKIRSFSRKPQIPICLVHTIEENWKFPALYRDILGSFDITELGRQLPETHEREARDQIEAMKSKLEDQELVRVQVMHSEDAAACLIAEAQLTSSRSDCHRSSEEPASAYPAWILGGTQPHATLADARPAPPPGFPQSLWKKKSGDSGRR